MAKQSQPAEGQMQWKDPGLSALLAWLIPGAGHFYQGRYAKAVVFSVCILGTFGYGMFLGGGRCVYAQWDPPSMRRYSFLCQAGAGLPAMPAVVAALRRPDEQPQEVFDLAHAKQEEKKRAVHCLPFLSRPWYMPPNVYFDRRDQKFVAPEMDRWYSDYHRRFELGTVFTMIAGLLNILAVYDAFGGPAYGATAQRQPDEKAKAAM